MRCADRPESVGVCPSCGDRAVGLSVTVGEVATVFPCGCRVVWWIDGSGIVNVKEAA